MSFEYDNAREIISALDSEIDTIVEQLCPIVGSSERWDFSKKKSKEIYDAISSLIEEIKDVAGEEIRDLEKKVSSLEDNVVALTIERAELEAKVADLTMRLEQPGKWYGNKFGL